MGRESIHTLEDKDFLEICKNIRDLVYKKLIVWCGIIEKCNELAELWKKEFKNFDVYTDTSVNSNEEFNLYAEKEKKMQSCLCL